MHVLPFPWVVLVGIHYVPCTVFQSAIGSDLAALFHFVTTLVLVFFFFFFFTNKFLERTKSYSPWSGAGLGSFPARDE